MTIILGIDPGSRITGYGVIRLEQRKMCYIDSGCIKVATKEIPDRLQEIFADLTTIVEAYRPTSAAIEQVFMHQNPGSALKLGQARGAAIVATTRFGIPMAEYSARQVKQSVVGYGAATKQQVQHMVCRLLDLNQLPQADAADALGIAICHAQTQQSLALLPGTKGTTRGRWR